MLDLASRPPIQAIFSNGGPINTSQGAFTLLARSVTFNESSWLCTTECELKIGCQTHLLYLELGLPTPFFPQYRIYRLLYHSPELESLTTVTILPHCILLASLFPLSLVRWVSYHFSTLKTVYFVMRGAYSGPQIRLIFIITERGSDQFHSESITQA